MLIPVTQINAPGGAMVQLYDNIAAGDIASWDVQGISQAYNHLRVVLLARANNAVLVQSNKLRFNNDSGANYNSNDISTASATTVANVELLTSTSANCGQNTGSSATASLAGTAEFIIPNYAGTTFHKSYVGTSFCDRGSTGNISNQTFGADWRSTAAINRITIFSAAGSYIAGSRLTIYGML